MAERDQNREVEDKEKNSRTEQRRRSNGLEMAQSLEDRFAIK